MGETTRQNDTGTDVLPFGAAVNSTGRVLVVGGGYTGQRFGSAARQRGLQVQFTRRDPDRCDGLSWLPFDSSTGLLPEPASLRGVTHVLITVPPVGAAHDPCLEQLGPMLRMLPLQWLGYLSTTGVYGDTGGAWVDETAPLNPGSVRSQARVAAEQAWQASGLPVQIVRLPAIYGPGRSPFQSLRARTSRLIHKPAQVFSRVHVDDIAGALLHGIDLPAERRPAVLNVADDCPCPSSETLGFAAHLLGCTLPPLERFEQIAPRLSPLALSFWAENRRASNRLLCQGLSYRLRYPSYREGYRACLAEERSTPQSGPSPGSAT